MVQGKWTPEEDQQLLDLVTQLGAKWTEIGTTLGRMASACRDRHREIRLGDSINKGECSFDRCGLPLDFCCCCWLAAPPPPLLLLA